MYIPTSLEVLIEESISITLGGDWNYKIPKSILSKLDKIPTNKPIIILLKEDFNLDFCGGEILNIWLQKHQKITQNQLLENPKSKKILTILQDNQPQNNALSKNPPKINGMKNVPNLLPNLIFVLGFMGEILYTLGLINFKNIRLKATLYHIQESLIKAIGIVSLACFLIGIVIAYQGSIQLEQFGASILIVEMSSILTLREMAPIITAIIIAGRSASAFSAEIGMMRATQEIDAMKTMGFNPMVFLVLPRILALCIALPLVVFIADIFGLLGAILISQLQLGIDYGQFIERFLEMVNIKHFWVGILKAPFFGFIISFIGCYHGFIVDKDTRSIGIHTTKSVVAAIFCVIAFDAICAMILTEVF
ncbi:MlaE family ABC transporter permease [Helicobacter mesocricetorum]|uniref:MlaE family ABC transporter permease n=1 Tax=Helicobacter mesocricetorum TaxID=87012 RepID=UPI001F335116|nr:ABC transporter permease [Helicobacter mesocricetorum]